VEKGLACLVASVRVNVNASASLVAVPLELAVVVVVVLVRSSWITIDWNAANATFSEEIVLNPSPKVVARVRRTSRYFCRYEVALREFQWHCVGAKERKQGH
jgi:hypothetical protein